MSSPCLLTLIKSDWFALFRFYLPVYQAISTPTGSFLSDLPTRPY